MAPPIELFPSSTLPLRSQTTLTNKKRKDFDGDLRKCEKFEMVQYECSVEGNGGQKGGNAGRVYASFYDEGNEDKFSRPMNL
jgi:hypothetical protein